MSESFEEDFKHGYVLQGNHRRQNEDSPVGLTITPMLDPDEDESMISEEYDEEAHIRTVMNMTAAQPSLLGNDTRRRPSLGAGAVRVPGIDDDPSTRQSQPDVENDVFVQNPIVAQLAHDDVDDVAARVAERLERRMTERLRHEVEARLALERANHFAAVEGQPMGQTAHVQQPQEVKIQQAEEASGENNFDMDDNFKICGIRRTCWGLILTTIFLLITGGLTSVIFQFTGNNYIGTRSTNLPTGSPTISPSDSNPNNPNISERIRNQVTFESDDDPYGKFKDPSTPQYKALDWLTSSDAFMDGRESTVSDQELVERYVLAVLYYSTLGPNWKSQLKFLEPTSICNWNNGIDSKNEEALGVYCSGSYVTYIQIVDNGLRDELPRELSLLSSLEHLNIDKNVLTGSIPSEFSSFPRLEVLWLSSNSLSGVLPTDLGQVTTLASIDLENNNFSGELPAEWGSLTNLFYLGLRLNFLEGTLPISSWMGVSNLKFFDIEGNDFEGRIPTELGLLTKLESLYMESNRLTGTLPSEMGQLTRLTELLVYDNKLTGTVPIQFANLKSLEYLWFHATDLIGNVDNVFCNPNPFIQHLSADCDGDSAEITCSCCSSCCNSEGIDCRTNY